MRIYAGAGSVALLLALLPGCRPLRGATVSAPPEFHFVDVAREAGLDFVHRIGKTRPLDILRTTGSGLAWLDYDRDGWPDLFCVNAHPAGETGGGHRLYRNRGDGTFADVTDQAGLRGSGQYGMGAAIGDYDADGYPDLFITCFGANHLYRNRGDGTFEEVTERMQAGGGQALDGAPKWSTAAAWWDADRDGDLDLYVANYCRFGPDAPRLCRINGHQTACPPSHYQGQRDLFFRNEGGKRLQEDRQLFNLRDRPPGRGLGVLPFDADGDGTADLFVANDGGGNFFFRHEGRVFREAAYECGVALDASGADPAGMGVDAADVDGNGLPDLILGNFQAVPNLLYRQHAPFRFRDESTQTGLALATRNGLTFGTCFADFNLDGAPEILFVNGHVQDNIASLQAGVNWEQRAQLFSLRDGTFDLIKAAGPALDAALAGRGAALADFDRDGDEDVAVSVSGGAVRLWRNDSRRGHWLQVELRGSKPNLEAIGARVTVETPAGSQTRDVLTGRSYLSDSERGLTFGLGGYSGPVKLRIRWPNGQRQALDVPGVDRRLHVEQAL